MKPGHKKQTDSSYLQVSYNTSQTAIGMAISSDSSTADATSTSLNHAYSGEEARATVANANPPANSNPPLDRPHLPTEWVVQGRQLEAFLRLCRIFPEDQLGGEQNALLCFNMEEAKMLCALANNYYKLLQVTFVRAYKDHQE